MRIVGGRWRSHPLEAPQGRDVTRPTTDRLRESIASMLLSAFCLDLSDVSVLDAFAGSGAVGLELLSRGALRCTFVERDRRAAARVRRNCESVGASPEEARVVCADALSLARKGTLAGGPFALVVLDPPYALEASAVARMVEDLDAHGLLAPGALVLYEHDRRRASLPLARMRTVKERTHGITTVTLLGRGGTDE
ncbi:methyltransferase [Olsenella uli DSM 7084]|uniref:Methyltransferase n=1 Tax=Olsenella uli (strain ATCC 49627 / DSM 7084 / CCUG 31166 / CIP 109912 / JCM 12494 / LMG 11480 / NCIMB 702895 / VPI D76D-27C) TaxID=633147 RepID=E1QVM0_OLSUV|nr:RsmD family RNA methyltransferase [Olsenella uli]ADK68173.1 methyltransferase [Olsenella uli DSM 7084]KRO13028.1 methyltransferase [Olsenella uli DSM 7084]MBS6418411.1 RsmD family RNA methyltransferase [Olsenella uli]